MKDQAHQLITHILPHNIFAPILDDANIARELLDLASNDEKLGISGELQRAIEDKAKQNPNMGLRWYDNIDISDLLFAMFNSDEFAKHTVCIHHYDKNTGKGLHQFSNNQTWSAKLVENLNGKILYHPIFTSALNPSFIDQSLNQMLDGIDDNSNGKAKLIIIPVLMHDNHFGIIAIAPKQKEEELQNTNKARVFYFNSMGSKSAYQDEEVLIFNSLVKRYNLTKPVEHCAIDCLQTDGSQCGPYIIWFAENAARLVNQGVDFLSNTFNVAEFGEIRMGGVNTVTLGMRAHHAKYLFNCQTNYSFDLFLQFQEMISVNKEWFKESSFVFEPSPEIAKHTRVVGSKIYLSDEGVISKSGQSRIREINGVDCFELQPNSINLLAQYLSRNNTRLLLQDKNVFRIIDNTSQKPGVENNIAGPDSSSLQSGITHNKPNVNTTIYSHVTSLLNKLLSPVYWLISSIKNILSAICGRCKVKSSNTDLVSHDSNSSVTGPGSRLQSQIKVTSHQQVASSLAQSLQ